MHMQRPKIVEISRVQHQHCTWPLSLPHCCRYSVYNVHVRTEPGAREHERERERERECARVCMCVCAVIVRSGWSNRDHIHLQDLRYLLFMLARSRKSEHCCRSGFPALTRKSILKRGRGPRARETRFHPSRNICPLRVNITIRINIRAGQRAGRAHSTF